MRPVFILPTLALATIILLAPTAQAQDMGSFGWINYDLKEGCDGAVIGISKGLMTGELARSEAMRECSQYKKHCGNHIGFGALYEDGSCASIAYGENETHCYITDGRGSSRKLADDSALSECRSVKDVSCQIVTSQCMTQSQPKSSTAYDLNRQSLLSILKLGQADQEPEETAKQEQENTNQNAALNRELNKKLDQAAKYGRVEDVRYLLNKGANPNALREAIIGHFPYKVEYYNRSQGPEYLPRAYRRQIEIVKLLLEAGAKANARALNRATYYGDRSGYGEIVKLLLEAGVDPNTQSDSGRFSPLKNAVKGGYNDIVKILLEGGADPNLGKASFIRPSPLMIAIENVIRGPRKSAYGAADAQEPSRHVEIVKLLLEAGADLDVIGRSYLSPFAKKAEEMGFGTVATIFYEADEAILRSQKKAEKKIQSLCGKYESITHQAIKNVSTAYGNEALGKLVEYSGMHGITYKGTQTGLNGPCAAIFSAQGTVDGSSYFKTFICPVDKFTVNGDKLVITSLSRHECKTY